MERKNNTELLATISEGKLLKPLEYFIKAYSKKSIVSAINVGTFRVIPKALYSNLVYKEW